MSEQFWSGKNSRNIFRRIVVEGKLVLETPAHFGNGDGDDLTDMPLLVDPYDGESPLLTGASLAGALRGHLRARQHGYRKAEDKDSASVLLFGSKKGDDEGTQSPLIIDDALGQGPGSVLRDSVKINPETRTAEEEKLFDVELWQAGTIFPMRFELLVYQPERQKNTPSGDELRHALATALTGLTDGSITLGMRKRRGYGRVSVTDWRAKTYDLTTTKGLFDWLENGAVPIGDDRKADSILAAIGLKADDLLPDQRQMFTVKAEFALDGSLLIRSGTGKDDLGPDITHLHSVQANGPKDDNGRLIPQPIISGTSLAGVLRARALRIANTLARNPNDANNLIDEVFGLYGEDIHPDLRAAASRLRVRESLIQNAENELVQNRVSLDRFTGGARDGALFNQMPAFGNENTRLTLHLQLDNPTQEYVGLLLLLLKDLWTGELPLGGESSVGRGRLQGRQAMLTWQNAPEDGEKKTKEWKIHANGSDLSSTGDNLQDLEDCVGALNRLLRGEDS